MDDAVAPPMPQVPLAEVLRRAPDPIVVIQHGWHVFANAAALEMYEADSLEQLRERPAIDYMHPDDRAAAVEQLEQIRRDGELAPVKERIVSLRGTVRNIEPAGIVIDVAGQDAMLLVVRDATELREREREVRIAEGRFQTAFHHAAIGMSLVDLDGRVLDANAAMLELFAARDVAELAGWEDFTPRRDRQQILERLADAERGEAHDATVPMVRRDGTTFMAAVHVAPLPAGDRATAVLQVRDVTAEHEAVSVLARRATHDELTNLRNRASFVEKLDDALADTSSPGTAVLFCDLDNFKVVNDSLGHDAGDLVLRRVADRLAEAVRPDDEVARFGGDEFTVLCPGVVEEAHAHAVASRLQAALQPAVDVDGEAFHARLSIGIALAGPGEVGSRQLLKAADEAMYAAKRAGRDRIRVQRPGSGAALQGRLRMEDDLRRALEHGGIVPWFQPLVDLDDGRVAGVEALARWLQDDGAPIAPGNFLPIAGETGLIRTLDRAIILAASQHVAQWHADGDVGDDFMVTVNTSVREFADEAFTAFVRAALEVTGLPPHMLVVEITERDATGDAVRVAERLQSLRALGLRVALDDFGVGTSSLSRLSSLPVDLLKLDRAFMVSLADEVRGRAMLRGVVDLAKGMDLAVLAEGLETECQVEQAVAAGVELGQGWVFAPAAPADDVRSLLDAPIGRRVLQEVADRGGHDDAA